jgi:hypothetical protein
MRRWKPLLVVVASAIGAAVAVDLTRKPVEGLVLGSLPEGVSHHKIEGVAVFLARNGRQVEGFLDSTQHLPGEHLWWVSTRKSSWDPGMLKCSMPTANSSKDPHFVTLTG